MTRNPLPPARGVLHPQLAPGRFEHLRKAPSQDLEPWVEHHWFVAWNLDGLPDRVQETLPHPNVHLTLEQGEARLWGVSRTRFTKRLSGCGWVYGLKFRVGGFHAFWPSPVAELPDCGIAADEVFGSAFDLLARPQLARDFEALVTVAESVLRERRPIDQDPRALHIAEIVRTIAEQPSITSVEGLSRWTGEHVRRLQRDFHRYVGASPKWVIARYRLHEAVALLQSGEVKADADLAHRLGYFDQAHFIRDFRQMVGRSPAAYLKSLGG